MVASTLDDHVDHQHDTRSDNRGCCRDASRAGTTRGWSELSPKVELRVRTHNPETLEQGTRSRRPGTPDAGEEREREREQGVSFL